jgi:serine/threonine-protein kinase
MGTDDRLSGDATASELSILLAALQERVLEMLEHGQPVEVESLLPDRPELRPEARRCVNDLLFLWEVDTAPAHGAATRLDVSHDRWGPGLVFDPFPGEFRVHRRAGEGAFSVVYEAVDLLLDRPVALKTPRATASPQDAARVEESFRRDGVFLARIHASRPHPNVVQVYAQRVAYGKPVLVLQLVRGGSLAGLVGKQGPLPWRRGLRYAADVAAGLEAVHEAGIVHRDVKPANVLLDADNDVALLADMGIANALAAATSMVGTPSYVAPELFYYGQASEASDVYSLAVTLFELLTGQPPFLGPTWGQLMDQIRAGLPCRERRLRGVPREAQQVIRAGLAADPDARPRLDDFRALREA